MKGFKYCQEATAQGHAMTMKEVGFCYDMDLGVDIDRVQALSWYQKATDMGCSMALYSLPISLPLSLLLTLPPPSRVREGEGDGDVM